MIEMISKLPDTAIAVLLTGTAWFGFNYAVLAERVMEHEVIAHALPACVSAVSAAQPPRPIINPVSGIGELFGLPELDELQRNILEASAPKALSAATIEARCACAVGTDRQNARFDYAVHTASFRIVPATSSANLRASVIDAATLGVCSEVAS